MSRRNWNLDKVKAQPKVQEEDEKLLTMQQAMDYLTSYGISCKSRKTFYKLLDDFNIPYTNMNPSGAYEMRRFPLTGLKRFLRKQRRLT